MTRRLTNLLLVIAGIAVAAWLLGRAIDVEQANASAREPIGATHTVPAAVEHTPGAPVSKAAALTAEPSSLAGKSASIRAIRSVFGARAPAAIRVAGCETGWTYDSRAVSRTGDFGLFQANYAAHHWRGESVAAFAARHFNLAYHVRWAFKLSRGGTNWRAWTCRP